MGGWRLQLWREDWLFGEEKGAGELEGEGDRGHGGGRGQVSWSRKGTGEMEGKGACEMEG